MLAPLPTTLPHPLFGGMQSVACRRYASVEVLGTNNVIGEPRNLCLACVVWPGWPATHHSQAPCTCTSSPFSHPCVDSVNNKTGWRLEQAPHHTGHM